LHDDLSRAQDREPAARQRYRSDRAIVMVPWQ
jgi:hypothetical protein